MVLAPARAAGLGPAACSNVVSAIAICFMFMFAPIRTLLGALQEDVSSGLAPLNRPPSDRHRSRANDVLSNSHAKPSGYPNAQMAFSDSLGHDARRIARPFRDGLLIDVEVL